MSVMKAIQHSVRVTSISRSCIRNVTTEVEVLQTTTPSIYTAAPMDPELNVSMYRAKAKEIFSLPPKFVLPSELNYVFPSNNVPEFAFVGRSNVGKSSLISRLLGDNKLVRISKLPGCTRSVNFFTFVKGSNKHIAYMVDLPGYGFAKAAKDEKSKWKSFIESYLRDRPASVLRLVVGSIDR
jgi:ribosome biogenesis GTPase A